jgi:hypothetical protein
MAIMFLPRANNIVAYGSYISARGNYIVAGGYWSLPVAIG